MLGGKIRTPPSLAILRFDKIPFARQGGLPVPVNPRAGKLAEASDLVNVPKLMTAYYTEQPDPAVREQRVEFGTSGHRGSALRCSFNEDHILAISQAICEYRKHQKIEGPLFIGKDTHALSECGLVTALEVLAANQVHVMVDAQGGFTPTPAVSHAILNHNHGRSSGLADGIVITPSHNPPEDGGSSTTLPTAAQPTRTPRSGLRSGRTNFWLITSGECCACRTPEPARRALHTFMITSRHM